jgi:hypothetical protein
MSEASGFILNRKYSITERRIRNILWYVVECYTILCREGVSYSKKKAGQNTKIAFEEYLRNRFVQDYLVKNKDLLKQKTSALEEINFLYETQKEYIDAQDRKQSIDQIDIYINKLGLRDVWNDNDENIYFAIECKKIEKLSDTTKYVSDIEKFVNRGYIDLRLPFEGQLAFIENPSITHIQLFRKINEKLNRKETVITDNFLSPISIHAQFDGTYLSVHKRNTDKQKSFSIYHLLFNYSDIVVD